MIRRIAASVLAVLAVTVPSLAQAPDLLPATTVGPAAGPATPLSRLRIVSASPEEADTPAAPGTPVGEGPLPAPAAVEDASAPFGFSNDGRIDGGSADDWRWWGNANYLLGWVSGDRLPPLVTTSPAGTAQTAAGVLGQQGTTVLVGGNTVNTGFRSGFRGELGYWFDPKRVWGIEAGFFALAGSSETFPASGAILARPFFDVTTGLPSSAIVAFPGASTGSVVVTDQAHSFYGANVDARENFCCGPGWRLDGLLGYRYLHYGQQLQIQQTTQPVGSFFAAGTQIQATDSFVTRNDFNGLDVGLRAHLTHDAWSVDFLSKVAAGRVERTVDIEGNTVASVPGAAPVTSTGGLLALSSNIGSHTSDAPTLVPELGLTVGWQVNDAVRVEVGYSALMLRAAQPGQQIDLNVNPGLIPGGTLQPGTPLNPAFNEQRSDVWVQGVQLGVEIRF